MPHEELRLCAASHQWLSLVDGIGTLLQASSATHHHSSLSTTTHLHTARLMIPTTRSRCRAPHSRPPRPERARLAIILHAQAWLGGTRSHERQRVHVTRWSARNRWFRGPAGRPASAPHGEMHFLFFYCRVCMRGLRSMRSWAAAKLLHLYRVGCVGAVPREIPGLLENSRPSERTRRPQTDSGSGYESFFLFFFTSSSARFGAHTST